MMQYNINMEYKDGINRNYIRETQDRRAQKISETIKEDIQTIMAVGLW